MMKKIKTFVRASFNWYRIRTNNRNFRQTMLDKIKTADIELRELTEEEKAEIDEFWKPFGINPDYNAFKWFYSVNGKKDPRYISEDLYQNYVWMTLNDMKRCKGLNDKNMLDITYAGYNLPETIFHNINGVFLDKDYHIIRKEKAIALAEEYNKIVIKEAVNSCQGKGVICVEGKECSRALDAFKKDYIVQKVVKQHSSFAQLNESSVNIVRMTSLLLNGEVNVLDSIVRVGAPGNFTDHKNISVGVEEDGSLKEYGITVKGRKETQFLNGYKFGGHKLVGFNEMVSLVKKLHPRTPQARLIGWDLTTDENGKPLIIEANMEFPGMVRGQECNGPFFGKLTEEVMKFVLK